MYLEDMKRSLKRTVAKLDESEASSLVLKSSSCVRVSRPVG